MKALTVKHPWAWAIINGGKDVENRSRPTKYRGQIYIHAGKSMAFDAFTFPALEKAERDYLTRGLRGPFDKINQIDLSTTGMVLGTVDVIDCHHSDDCREKNYCSEWAMPDHYHWVLANPRPLACPFPETGKLGLWTLGVTP